MYVAEAVVEVVGAAARSVILHGSLASGGFVAGRSDIDLLVVIDGAPADPSALEHLVRHAELGDAAGVDLHVVTADVAASPGPAPTVELYVGRHDGSSVGFEVERRVAAPDLLAELSMARAHGRALWGAAPAEVIGPVPAEWIVDRGRYWLTTWLTLTGDTEHATFMAHTACRIWRFAVENVHCSKTEAAAWALEREPAVRPALEHDERALAALLTRVLNETSPGRNRGSSAQI
ncbi:aminoglycoside adenylyltransferase domain-containing protein [Actinoplanes sp. NPDC051633]|uniref:aminoglycoside adenylyltransferase domain-containing protein n=1 Tax=Actinoplanes sp. NPDC051633 TaxID=3155670 RepID=UPI00342A2E3A